MLNKSAVIWLLLIPCLLHAQPKPPALYLHTDKTTYTGHEIIWFTAYVINGYVADTSEYNTVFVELIDPLRGKPVLSGRFAMAYGVGEGVLQLPDSLPAGEYSLVAYTNHLFTHPEDAVFHSWISVRYSSSGNIPFFRTPEDSSLAPVTCLVTLQADSTRYPVRTKTKWKVHLTDTTGHPIQGIFSVACVYAARRKNHFIDIRGFAHSCYNVPGLIVDTAAPFEAQVGFGNKKYLKSPVQLLVASNRNLKLVVTSKAGHYVIPPDYLLGDFGTDVKISVMPERKETQQQYTLVVNERDKRVNAALVTRQWPVRIADGKPEPVFAEQERILDKKTLKAVIVKAKPIEYWKRPEYYELPIMDGPCAAWVCACGHWKCGGCKPLYSPVKGVIYEDQENHRMFKYEGCPLDTVIQSFLAKVKPVTVARPFQATDFSQEHPDGSFLNTTLYFNYFVATDEHGDAAFEFYTNDLVGIFDVVIQGVTMKGLISATKSFTVYDPERH